MKQPLVSVIIPTYNRACLIGQTLDSVLAQTYENWECIVIDDGSTDFTEELLGFYMEKDARIQYYHRSENRPKGANACRNYGFEISTGEYINWLDSDDLFSENKLTDQIKLVKTESQFTLAFCKWGILNQNNGNITIYDDFEVYQNFNKVQDFLDCLAVNKGFLPSHCYLIPRKLIVYSGLWIEKLVMNQDGEFMIRLMLNVKKFVFEEKSYVLYRNDHQDRISQLDNKGKVKMMIESWKIIDGYLRIHNFKRTKFISKSKSGVYKNVKKSFPELILENKSFFKNEIYADKCENSLLSIFFKKSSKFLGWVKV